jgi:hypothetical protein
VATCPVTTLPTGRFLIGLVGDGTATYRAIRGSLPLGAVGSALGASLVHVLYYKPGMSTAAFTSPGTQWDTILTGTTPTEYLAFLRLTAV